MSIILHIVKNRPGKIFCIVRKPYCLSYFLILQILRGNTVINCAYITMDFPRFGVNFCLSTNLIVKPKSTFSTDFSTENAVEN